MAAMQAVTRFVGVGHALPCADLAKEATTMPTVPSDRYRIRQTLMRRRVCAWCAADLGALPYLSAQHSYGICATCAHQYFADLYIAEECETVSPVLRERTVGAA
jgi:hypothetical protein